MDIRTKYFGAIRIKNEEIVHFEGGIPGFLNEQQFCILPMEGTPFFVLQSVKDENIAFVLADPFLHDPNYHFDLDDDVKEKLEIAEPKDVAVFAILTVHEPLTDTTANFQAPIVINQTKKLGKQIILQDKQLKLRTKIFQANLPNGMEG
ncbi:flagellar assembly protein FliW [Cytobacillus sp. Hz8]|uniref:flagellar assembly protein FliW n=1 Tax=Cytobacillus sp. Hz8 TaxID=3347168 RepID=UPI0035DCBDD0